MRQLFFKDDPLWFKDAIIYEVPVKSFMDSDADGIGDFRGLTSKLDYIQDLGVTAIWLLPFFPSPLRDDGYDVSDYVTVNPIYGDLEDFKTCLQAAHQRGLRVIIELIVNHTSDQHPWFQRARRAAPGSWERDFYVWSDTPEKYSGVRIIFQDFEPSNWTWDPVAQSYYWHRFYSHQPDLNFEHPALQDALFEAVDFWLNLGVDGMRLDAVPYLFEQDGTNCENLPKTHNFLQKLRSHIDRNFPNRMLLAEANQWPEDAAAYFGQGDECHMNFHFPLMPRLFMALQMEDSFPIIDILQQTPQIPDNCQWALFLRNHDELTLEMVSDEDRDYMYKVYAQDQQARINLGIRRRLAPLVGNNRRQIELMNSLLLSLPGTPVLYYGDEIGMGDNYYLGDRNGVRTPMQWSSDRNAGFSQANPQKLYLPIIVDPEYNYETINVEAQRANPNSLWWWMKRIMATRSRYQAFGRGTFEFLYPENRKVLAFIRTYQGEHLLVVANLARFAQSIELDLSAFKGMQPIEIFGRSPFPAISEAPYCLSLGAHSFYWFTLELQESWVGSLKPAELPTLSIRGNWRDLYTKSECKQLLEHVLPNYLQRCHWCNGRSRLIQTVQVLDVIPLSSQVLSQSQSSQAASEDASEGASKDSRSSTDIVLIKVSYTEGMPDTYVLPIAYLAKETTPSLHASDSLTERAIAHVQSQLDRQSDRSPESGILIEALAAQDFLTVPLERIQNQTPLPGEQGQLTPVLLELPVPGLTPFEAHLQIQPTTNSFIIYASCIDGSTVCQNRYLFKLFHQVEECINSDYEITRFLTQASTHAGILPRESFAPVLGALEYHRKGVAPMTIGMLQKFAHETVSAWSYVLDNYQALLDSIMTRQAQTEPLPTPPSMLSMVVAAEIPELAYEIMGGFLSAVELLGQRTAELHLTLATNSQDPAFAPEPFTSFYQRSIYQYMRNQAGKILLRLKKDMKHLPESLESSVQLLISQQDALMERYRRVIDQPITTMRIRCHGNYHLEEVLYTGKDFVIVDFEGEVTRSLSERRMKRSPLRDVAGMLESFYYAAQVALRREVETGLVRAENRILMENWTQFLYNWSSLAFLKQYLTTAAGAPFLPQTATELQILLEAYLLEKVMYEINYELDHRPDWLEIPLKRVLDLLDLKPIDLLRN